MSAKFALDSSVVTCRWARVLPVAQGLSQGPDRIPTLCSISAKGEKNSRFRTWECNLRQCLVDDCSRDLTREESDGDGRDRIGTLNPCLTDKIGGVLSGTPHVLWWNFGFFLVLPIDLEVLNESKVEADGRL